MRAFTACRAVWVEIWNKIPGVIFNTSHIQSWKHLTWPVPLVGKITHLVLFFFSCTLLMWYLISNSCLSRQTQTYKKANQTGYGEKEPKKSGSNGTDVSGWSYSSRTSKCRPPPTLLVYSIQLTSIRTVIWVHYKANMYLFECFFKFKINTVFRTR